MILAVIEYDRSPQGAQLNDLSLQMLALGRRLAEQLHGPLHAVVIGAGGRSVAGSLGGHGVAVVHLVEDGSGRLEEYAPQAWARAIVEVTSAVQPAAVLAAGTDRGHELMAHVGAQLDLPVAANCTEVTPGDPWMVTRLRWGGSLLEEAELGGAVKLLTVAPHSFAAEEVDAAAPRIASFSPQLEETDFRVRVAGRVEPDRSKISLADAKVVVGGGRGVGSPEAFALLEEIASLLGGTVGCSRAVTSLGWRPHADQVGQTGTRIAPDLYLACGISGAIQHMVGCRSAKHLIAINKDPDAPIMAQADYTVVGDLQQVLPALRDALREAVGQHRDAAPAVR
ncbi:MAG TPA: electron transfer flavoprotein subunit alpha/FixB family protein [Chloroflexota bacterium]|nr:electron transfer flavoprotein subunit alpha/FixB family protein [Chloroflexota bacterium]